MAGAPVELSSAWSLNLLLLSDDELVDLFSAFNFTCAAHSGPVVSPRLQLAMERVCGRQVGLLRAALRLFMCAFKGKGAVTREEEADFVASSLMSIGHGLELPALPKFTLASDEERAALIKVARAGEDGLQVCSAGILDMEVLCPSLSRRIRFSSPAMRAHAILRIGARPDLVLPITALDNPAEFVRAAVKRMRSSALAGSACKAGSRDAFTQKHGAKASKTSPLERQYQTSFNSAVVTLLPKGVFMSLDVGPVEDVSSQRTRYIHFFVAGSHRIGIELIRDGQGLHEHSARFGVVMGACVPLKLKSWVTVDFRHTQPRSTRGKGETVFVVLSADFKRATIMQEGHPDEHVALPP